MSLKYLCYFYLFCLEILTGRLNPDPLLFYTKIQKRKQQVIQQLFESIRNHHAHEFAFFLLIRQDYSKIEFFFSDTQLIQTICNQIYLTFEFLFFLFLLCIYIFVLDAFYSLFAFCLYYLIERKLIFIWYFCLNKTLYYIN